MDKILKKNSKGQILVIVVLMVVGLLAMLALVLDGGNVFSQRRAAQLAADAGALAGARAYCTTEKNPVKAAKDAAQKYVDLNHAFLENVSVEAETGDVTVDTSITFNTFFLHILGRPQLTAPASATAACGPPKEATVLPIAWSCKPPSDPEPGEFPGEYPLDCDLRTRAITHTECVFNTNDTGENDPMYLIVDSADIASEVVCVEDVDPLEMITGTITYATCDINGDDEKDLFPLSGGNRAWLDLTGGGGGAAELIDWIENGPPGKIDIHTWFAGQTGVAVSIYNAVNDHVMDQKEVVIPVFDAFCPNGANDDHTKVDESCEHLWHPNIEFPLPIQDVFIYDGGASTDYFHIISFALFDVTCVDAGGNPKGGKTGCPVHEAANLSPDVKTIEGCFVEGFNPELGSGGGSVNVGAVVVYLVK